jgi:hypothetical protein
MMLSTVRRNFTPSRTPYKGRFFENQVR